ncbi:hypothetical protein [Phycicoccus jejuensis]|uniref:hypothetical protein n=1 Tax=Phycicoccus jejuensis TaxID=367299 RepID=UPI0004C2D303|nr:hypothetical protein [Phycicoccus jejuensis]
MSSRDLFEDATPEEGASGETTVDAWDGPLPHGLTQEQVRGLVAAMPAIVDALRPAWEAQSELARRAARAIAPALVQFGRAARLAAESVSPLVEYVAHVERARPENWRSVWDYPRLAQLAREGYPIMWVPDSATLGQMLDAPPAQRTQVLIDNASRVLQHADDVLSQVTHGDLVAYADVMRQAVRCVQTAPAPAQALSLQVATVAGIEAVNARGVGDLYRYLEDLADITDARQVERLATALSVLCLQRALTRWNPGDSVPSTPNRHNVSHAVDPQQYSPANAIWSVLLAVSVLRQLQEERRQFAAQTDSG